MQRLQSIEAAGATIEAAIARGLEALNAERRAVDIEVLSDASAREARVRLTLKAEPPPVAAATESVSAPASPPLNTGDAAIAQQVLSDMLRHMQLPAEVEARLVEAGADQATDETLVSLNITGVDSSLLIGRRGETLENLQYLVRLLVSKAAGHFVNLTIDVEGYKSHREQMLQQLAQRMADRVTQTQRPATLEPMPANERRIIHLTLRNHPAVRTESVGVGDNRKVTIVPKTPRH